MGFFSNAIDWIRTEYWCRRGDLHLWLHPVDPDWKPTEEDNARYHELCVEVLKSKVEKGKMSCEAATAILAHLDDIGQISIGNMTEDEVIERFFGRAAIIARG